MSEKTFKLNYILAPISWLYGMGVSIRNSLFDWKILPSEEYPVPVICIGNLAVGGTGKTPHTEYLIRLLRDKYKLGVLSRGYKRKTKGYVLATEKSTSSTIGDEPYQMKRKFNDVVFAVDSNRRRGITNLLSLPDDEKPDVILMDDAFQHRYVTPSLSILLTDYNRLFYHDKLLPFGRLRESKTEKRRADIVIVTNTADDLKPIDFRIIEEEMNLKEGQQTFFTQVFYGPITPVFPNEPGSESHKTIEKEDELLLLAGIASPIPFVRKIKSLSDKAVSMIFPDHHAYEKQDIKKIKATFDNIKSPDKYILTTEKDAARLLRNPSLPEEWKSLLYCLPIEIEFCLEERPTFDELITNHITTFKRNNIYK